MTDENRERMMRKFIDRFKESPVEHVRNALSQIAPTIDWSNVSLETMAHEWAVNSLSHNLDRVSALVDLQTVTKPEGTTPAVLTQGEYILTASIPNPSLDKRVRHDWRRAPTRFEKDSIFTVHEYRTGTNGDSILLGHEISPKGTTSRVLLAKIDEKAPDAERMKVDRNYRLLWALVPYLKRTGDLIHDDTPAQRIKRLEAERVQLINIADEAIARLKNKDIWVDDLVLRLRAFKRVA